MVGVDQPLMHGDAEHAAVKEMRRLDQIGMGIEMDQGERPMLLSVGFERGVAHEMVAAETERGHLGIGERIDLLDRRDPVLCASRKRDDVAGVDQAEAILEGIIVWPALIIEAEIAGLLADGARAEPRSRPVRRAGIEGDAIDRDIDSLELLAVRRAPETQRTLIGQAPEDRGWIDIFGRHRHTIVEIR